MPVMKECVVACAYNEEQAVTHTLMHAKRACGEASVVKKPACEMPLSRKNMGVRHKYHGS
ncbi:hypothetical protein [Bartonella vinsonii]|uniref:hypothetical protein n=1 Tax=Bartonella vinsonii TaxID=33047 RepID=UPI00047B146E|nr:hypothetical protein [Bartonella vinsonii]